MMTLIRLYLSFLKIGFSSFGGMTMIPIINDEVLRYGWMTSAEVMDVVAIAEMTPGSLGINCATFAGIKIAGLAGALSATLGVMTPSLTVCLAAAIFIERLRGNRWLEAALKGVRPVSFGMLLSVVVSMSSVFLNQSQIAWNRVAISVFILFAMKKWSLSIPKTILMSVFLGLLFGF